MRTLIFPGLAFLLTVSFCSAQSIKGSNSTDMPAILVSAQSVFVEPYSPTNEGSIYDPNVSADDRDAVTSVLEALQKWGYYKLAIRRREADIVVSVRRGRSSHSYSSVHVQTGRPSPDTPSQTTGTGIGTREGNEAGPNEDLFYVYWRNTEEKLNGPIWQQSVKDGLAMPKLVLFQTFKDEVTAKAVEQAKKKAAPKGTP